MWRCLTTAAWIAMAVDPLWGTSLCDCESGAWIVSALNDLVHCVIPEDVDECDVALRIPAGTMMIPSFPGQVSIGSVERLKGLHVTISSVMVVDERGLYECNVAQNQAGPKPLSTPGLPIMSQFRINKDYRCSELEGPVEVTTIWFVLSREPIDTSRVLLSWKVRPSLVDPVDVPSIKDLDWQ
eukprot:Protomagalhaensia_wolfi_Nauph_80__1210@NODE_1713_length_1384_cov_1921_430483_g1329_i0_p1_GENE_NODE_1713_length_1384_cov_1921_430483_g1329_i0NODE_1713_length_1384_cov_1921_430483_g1329_i0_p1_ORF_typecomplete_len183_score25_94_NODE_1713_length_1384_cov_1921_430483_g1329_i06431191